LKIDKLAMKQSKSGLPQNSLLQVPDPNLPGQALKYKKIDIKVKSFGFSLNDDLKKKVKIKFLRIISAHLSHKIKLPGAVFILVFGTVRYSRKYRVGIFRYSRCAGNSPLLPSYSEDGRRI